MQHLTEQWAKVASSDDYAKHYNRGWAAGNRGGDVLDKADSRGEPEAWYDGYHDAAGGRPKWTTKTASSEPDYVALAKQRHPGVKGEIKRDPRDGSVWFVKGPASGNPRRAAGHRFVQTRGQFTGPTAGTMLPDLEVVATWDSLGEVG